MCLSFLFKTEKLTLFENFQPGSLNAMIKSTEIEITNYCIKRLDGL